MVWGKPRRGFNEEQAYDFVSQTNANVTGLTKSVRDTPDGDIEVWSEVGVQIATTPFRPKLRR